jgi:hypothetical protein
MEDDFSIEGIDVTKLDEAGKKLYAQLEGQFKGAYTKKTQALSEKQKEWEAEKATLSQEAATYKAEIDGFNGWWNSMTPQQQAYYKTLSPGQQEAILDERGLVNPEVSAQDYKVVAEELQGLRTWGQQEFGKVGNRVASLESSMPLFMDLVDFRFKHPDADWKRVMKRAQTDNLRNFDLAYQLEYGEELKEKEVNEKVERKLAEEKDKSTAESKLPEFTPGKSIFSPDAEKPAAKSWSEASSHFKEGLASAKPA